MVLKCTLAVILLFASFVVSSEKLNDPEESLFSAADRGDMQSVTRILNTGCTFSAEEAGWTLFLIVQKSQPSAEAVTLILEKCPHISTDLACVSLGLAASSQQFEALELILQKRTDLTLQHLLWALRCAVENNDNTRVNALIEKFTYFIRQELLDVLKFAEAKNHHTSSHILRNFIQKLECPF